MNSEFSFNFDTCLQPQCLKHLLGLGGKNHSDFFLLMKIQTYGVNERQNLSSKVGGITVFFASSWLLLYSIQLRNAVEQTS